MPEHDRVPGTRSLGLPSSASFQPRDDQRRSEASLRRAMRPHTPPWDGITRALSDKCSLGNNGGTRGRERAWSQTEGGEAPPEHPGYGRRHRGQNPIPVCVNLKKDPVQEARILSRHLSLKNSLSSRLSPTRRPYDAEPEYSLRSIGRFCSRRQPTNMLDGKNPYWPFEPSC